MSEVETVDDIGYGGPRVCKIVGITYRQLDYWDREGILSPSITEASGSGTQRRYSHTDVVLLTVIQSLLNAGQSLARARTVIEQIGPLPFDDLTERFIVIDDTHATLVDPEGLARVVDDADCSLVVVQMGKVLARLAAAIDNAATRQDQADIASQVNEQRAPRPVAPRPAPKSKTDLSVALSVPGPTCMALPGAACREGGREVQHTHFMRKPVVAPTHSRTLRGSGVCGGSAELTDFS